MRACERVAGFEPAYMLDQSHNVTDPIESLATSATSWCARTSRRTSSIARRWPAIRTRNDALMALQTLKQAFTCDVSPVLAMARLRAGGAIDPVATYRAIRISRNRKRRERPLAASAQAGIV